jgi:hypothetical protein
MEKIIIDTVQVWQLEVGDTVDFGDGNEVTIKYIDDQTSIVYITDTEGEEYSFYPQVKVSVLGYES